MRILIWHVHGSWTTAFVQGRHTYLLPVNAARDGDGLGRARTWTWPDSAIEVGPEHVAERDFDVVILQRPHEAELVERWTGLRPGVDVPALYLEHNTPPLSDPSGTHPMVDRPTIPIVHVTRFNAMSWDSGANRTEVIEHGVIDPGHRFSGDWPRAAVVMNDPIRRAHVLGTDLLPHLAADLPLDVFGMRVQPLRDEPWSTGVWTFEDLPQDRMHTEIARRRMYLHTARWTSLGLSLIEAMMLGIPVVALKATEAPRAVPPGAGFVEPNVDGIRSSALRLLNEPMLAQDVGRRGREAALYRYGLKRFLTDWDELLDREVG